MLIRHQYDERGAVRRGAEHARVTDGRWGGAISNAAPAQVPCLETLKALHKAIKLRPLQDTALFDRAYYVGKIPECHLSI